MKLALFAILSLFALPAFAAVNLSVESLVQTVVYLLIVGAILWLLLFIIAKVPLAEPFGQVARVVVYIVGALILIGFLLGLAGHPIVNWR